MVNPLHTSSCRCGDRTRSPRSHSYLCSRGLTRLSLPATRIILGIHTLLLGTGGRGCGGPGIRTITATGCRERDTHRRAYGADAGRGGTPRRNRRCCRSCRFAHLYRCSPRRSRRKRRYGKNAIQNFFHNNFPSLNEWRFTQNISGGIEYTQLKHANYGAGN